MFVCLCVSADRGKSFGKVRHSNAGMTHRTPAQHKPNCWHQMWLTRIISLQLLSTLKKKPHWFNWQYVCSTYCTAHSVFVPCATDNFNHFYWLKNCTPQNFLTYRGFLFLLFLWFDLSITCKQIFRSPKTFQGEDFKKTLLCCLRVYSKPGFYGWPSSPKATSYK